MQGIKYLLTITHREFFEQYVDSLKKKGITYVTSMLCQGTAKDSVLDLLDIEKTDKVMIEAMVKDEDLKAIENSLIEELNIYTPGNGIAVFIPVDGLGGAYAKTRLLGEVELNKEKECLRKFLQSGQPPVQKDLEQHDRKCVAVSARPKPQTPD